MPDDETIPTRASFLQRLKDKADLASCDEFLRIRGLVGGVTRRAS